jgi:glucuronate isomerase
MISLSNNTPFISEDWLLDTSVARTLYHEYAAQQPIIDYHNHLPPQLLAEDHHFPNLHAAWLAGDHYKWRAMRMFGVAEALITGDADPREKFRAYAKTLPYTVRNPLFHWSHLELKRYFNVDDLLTEENADRIYDQAGEILSGSEGGTWGLLAGRKVRVVCTTDDPIDHLEHHEHLRKKECPVKMLPCWRPDKALLINDPGWFGYVQNLAEVGGIRISDYQDLVGALEKRMDFFAARGCTIADHGLEFVPDVPYNRTLAAEAFHHRLTEPDDTVPAFSAQTFLLTLLVDLGRKYASRNWVMQLHLGALRNNNYRGLRELGPDAGFDSIGDFPQARGLSHFLNNLDNTGELPKTILYNQNPADNAVFATMIGNFASGGARGKIQWGAAWWFLDQWDGMRDQINTLSNMGLLSTFVGMLTDSRSFLSYPRHEYFRRLLCNLIGQDVAAGRLPADIPFLGELIAGICYGNAREYFDFD